MLAALALGVPTGAWLIVVLVLAIVGAALYMGGQTRPAWACAFAALIVTILILVGAAR